MIDKLSLIDIKNNNVSWEVAIKNGVQLLVNQEIATMKLADSIIENTNKLGPYYVLMPKVALAHTSPGSYNKKIGLSIILFKEEIKFSNDERHKVNLLFTLSAIDGSSHMDILAKFSQLLSNDEVVKKALDATTKKELYEIFKELL